ncbi:hypothetical protein M2451_004023 [Dysgonomonas sp. PFB1-18]|nr:hypothetical protein [Dysgonomonas sp. PF1-14]MDH6340909.1 hypothetical protein [Dysgonomonas sp. PF1-16]MDH6382676.1 hypothetical protein [Dysgonomonas sp. PFB1-18]MDH6399896.1 hypothetical protein [Dysgonomonas sp. PF1-23]
MKNVINILILLGNIFFYPSLLLVVIALIFRQELDHFQYGQIIRIILFIILFVSVLGNIFKLTRSNKD